MNQSDCDCEPCEPAEATLCKAPESGMAGTPVRNPAKYPSGADDPFLGCLLIINRTWQCPVSPAALVKALSREGHRLTLEFLGSAAANAGWSTELVEMGLDDIADSVLPAILLLGKGRPCVLLERRGHGRFLIALPGWGGGVQEVEREALLAEYSRYAVLAEPAMQAHAQAYTAPAPIWSTSVAMRRSSPWDRLVAIAHKVLWLQGRHRVEEAAGAGG